MGQSDKEGSIPHKTEYQAFLLRLWRVKVNGEPAWRASLEQVDSGEKRGFVSLEALFAYLEEFAGRSADVQERRGNGVE